MRKFKNNSAYRGFMEEMGRPLYTFKGDGGYIGIGMSMAASEAHQAAEIMNRTDQFTCPVSHDGRAPAVQNSRSFPIRNKTAPSAARLAKLGLARAFDFVLHLPLRYEDETALTPIRAAQPGIAAQIEGIVSASEIT